MNAKKIANAFEAKNARKAIGAVLIHGTEWLLLAGVLVLLTADVWLGAQVYMSRGMDLWTSYLVATATSAVQITLFANGGELIGKATGKWKIAVGYVALTVGWGVAVLDSFIDGLAALVKLGSGIPSTWHKIWVMLGDPIVLVAFIVFFILSLFGERLARLVIFGEFEDTHESAITEPTRPIFAESVFEEPSTPLDVLRNQHPAPRKFQVSL